MTEPATLLREVGEALYGPRWQSEMARALGIAERTVRHWLAGRQNPRPGIWRDLHRIARERGAGIVHILRALEQRNAA